jgi:hypothetical protein
MIFDRNFQRRIDSAVRRVEAAPPPPAPQERPPEMVFVEITSTTQTSDRYPGNYRVYDADGKTWSDGSDCWVVDANSVGLVTGRQYAGHIWESEIGSPSKAVVIVDRDSNDAQSVTAVTVGTGQNDYAVPTDVLAVNPSSSFAFTGFEAPDSGSRVIEIINTGSNTISFTSESASSTAANRIYNPSGFALTARQSGYLIYDTVNARWNVAFPASVSGITNGSVSGQFWRMNEAGNAQVWRGNANDFLVDTTITAAQNGESWRHTSATPHAVTLPAVADCGNQWYAYFYNDNSGTVTVSVPSGSFLHGTASFTLEQDECALVHTTGGGGFGVYRSWALTVPATRFGLLNALTDATPAAADRFPFYDDSAAANRDCSGTGLAEMVETILGLREVLTAARTYYVRTDGSDSNTGLADSAGGAFLTIQKAVDTVAALDISIYDVTIQVRSGTFTGAIAIDGPWIGSGDVALVGDTTTPGNVIISVAGNCITVEAYAHVSVRGFKLTSSAGDQGLIYCKDNATVNIDGKMEFGAANTFHLYCFTGGNINITADYTINGNAVGGFAADRGASINFSGTITATMSGTPAFSGAAHMRVAGTSVIEGLAGVTFSGAATGTRYDAQTNGVINTAGGGANYIPGNAAGSTATGGQYV